MSESKRFIWDLVIIILNIVNTVLIPLEVGFSPKFTEKGGYIFLDYALCLAFLADIIVNLRTSFTNEMGEEVFNPKEIAKHYIPTLIFGCDLISIL